MVKLFDSEQGNIAAPLMVLVGGVSLFLAQGEMNNVKNRVSQVREESRNNYMGQQNVSALQQAARLLVGDVPQLAAPVRLDPYIPANFICEQGRQLTAANGLNWQSTGQSITVQTLTQDRLQNSGDAIFNQLSQGNAPAVTTNATTQLKVLGWKCNNYLVEGVYVEAESTSPGTGSTSNKKSKTKALLAMAPPPPSTCLFYAKDAAGNVYPNNKKPTTNLELPVPTTAAEVYLECNNVVTDAEVLNNGTTLGATNSYPLTAANRIDDAQKLLLGPLPLVPGNNILEALVSQVDGTKISLGMTLTLDFPAPAPDPIATSPVEDPISSKKKKDCSSKCLYLPGEIYPNLCDDRLVHKDYYNSVSPKHFVCYQCGVYIGFDPENDCQNVGPVGTRGPEGCFAKDTQIRLPDGRDVSIQSLKAGDKVWNPLLKRAVSVAKVVRGPENKPLYQIVQGDRTVRVTQTHPFVTPLGLIPASQLRVGDLIQSEDGRWAAVDAVVKETQKYDDDVFNLELAADAYTEAAHMVVANGIMSGDLFLQKRVQSRPLLEAFRLANMDEFEP
ncbi:Hint domain-containing protein [Oligoflexus tunisiensis]|uniref:Hint domain-containing protein n=1 Tax=Oligoflexus tunisiensis TaxID=708132 RepID=UPI00114CD1F6|nr:Hint domain-containing protein [Oligoflexus tunisiensis]